MAPSGGIGTIIQDELEKWALRIKASGAKRAWVYFNNDYEALLRKTPALCVACSHILK